jgi:hypothetical protein
MMSKMLEIVEVGEESRLRATLYDDGVTVLRMRDEDSFWTYIRLTKKQTDALAAYLGDA